MSFSEANKLKLFQIDAFAHGLFKGNPAAVCPLQTWLADDVLQAIAAENNLSETAFFIPQDSGFSIRWFTPTVEVNLCGHATLASAFVLFEELGYQHDTIHFFSKSGQLTVCKENDLLVLDFPQQVPIRCHVPDAIQQCFGDHIVECLKAEDYIVVLNQALDVAHANPQMDVLKKLDLRGVVITATAQDCDFVSRFFAPNFGINEDPATGSAFTQLMPYWAAKLGKTKLYAKQVSARGGDFWCEIVDERVKIAGKAVKYLEGEISLK